MEDRLDNPPESRLWLERSGTVVSVAVKVRDTGDRVFRFAFDAGTEWAAVLLHNAIQQQLVKAMETARRDAYEAGWKDRAGKKTKRTWFWGRLV